jgi:hypothetical protein
VRVLLSFCFCFYSLYCLSGSVEIQQHNDVIVTHPSLLFAPLEFVRCLGDLLFSNIPLCYYGLVLVSQRCSFTCTCYSVKLSEQEGNYNSHNSVSTLKDLIVGGTKYM